MKKLINIIVYVLIIGLVLFVWESIKSFSFFKKKEAETSHHVILKEITDLGKLELVKYSYRDIVEQKINIDFLPDPKALIVVEGEAVGCVNLKKVLVDDIVLKNDTLIVNLPKPEICYHKIDHTKSKVYHTQYAFMNEGLLLEEAYKKAESKILESALASDILLQTQNNAILMLKPLLENVSGKKVVLAFPLDTQLPQLK